VRHYDGEVVDGKDPMGRSHFWFVVKPIEGTDPDSDRWAVEHGYTSITPLRIDLTDEPLLSGRSQMTDSVTSDNRCEPNLSKSRRTHG